MRAEMSGLPIAAGSFEDSWRIAKCNTGNVYGGKHSIQTLGSNATHLRNYRSAKLGRDVKDHEVTLLSAWMKADDKN